MDPTAELIEELRRRALGRVTGEALPTAHASRHTLFEHLAAAGTNADVDSMPTPPGSNRFLKRIVLSLGRFSWVRQRATNRALLGAISELVAELDSLHDDLGKDRKRTSMGFGALEADIARQSERLEAGERRQSASVDDVREQLHKFEDRLASLDSALAELAGRADDTDARFVRSRRDLEVVEHRLHWMRRDLRHLLQGEPAPEHVPAVSDADLLAELYQRFEDEFRASADLAERFRPYLDYLWSLREGTLRVLDLGCGRGDFLDVLAASHIPCFGLDSNTEAVRQCRERGHEVVEQDAMQYLASLPDAGLAAVSAFHVVEHIEPAALLRLLDEIRRVLVPGGLVILETPNPSNLMVGASSFYRDPTHLRPIPADYLSFVVADRGFVDVETKFLHPSAEYELALPERSGNEGVKLLLDDVAWALRGPQDYATIARRPIAR